MLRSCAVLLGLPDIDPGALPDPEQLLAVARDAVFEEGALRCLLAVRSPDAAIAAAHLSVTLDLAQRSGLWFLEELSTAVAVTAAVRAGQYERAALLIGGLSSRWPAIQLQVAPGHRHLYEASRAEAAEALGEPAFSRLETQGSLGGWNDTLECCRGLLADLRAPAGGATGRLTARERQVLDEMAKGLTNKEVAIALGMRPKTVSHHASSIFRKLGVRTRTAAVIRGRSWTQGSDAPS